MPMRDPTGEDVTLIGSSPEAFEAFYREHVESVQRFVARRVGDPYLAADLTADVFVAAIESAASYDPRRGEPRPWLFGVARNVVASSRRDRARRLGADRRVSGRALVDEDDLARLHERLEAEASARELHDQLERLPDGERAILELVALDGLTVTEAARAAGVSPVAARVRLHRARHRLRSGLESTAIDVNDLSEVSS